MWGKRYWNSNIREGSLQKEEDNWLSAVTRAQGVSKKKKKKVPDITNVRLDQDWDIPANFSHIIGDFGKTKFWRGEKDVQSKEWRQEVFKAFSRILTTLWGKS